MAAKWFIGFADGTSFHTCNLDSDAWVIYSPSGQLVSSGGACLGPAINNLAEYRVVIEILWDALSCGIIQLEVKLDSQLMVSQLNGDYQVRNPICLRQFLQVRLLEINFKYISFNHIPQNENKIIDTFETHVNNQEIYIYMCVCVCKICPYIDRVLI